MVATLWIVGDWERDVFLEPLAFLGRGRQCEFFDRPSAAAAAIDKGGCPPRAIVIVQARPGQFSRGEVERLHAAASLARIVALTGPWCEGEGRSGKPWPGVTRVAWRNWPGRLAVELGSFRDGAAKELRLPRTATDGERIEGSLAALGPRRLDGLAHVYSQSRLTFETLAAGLGRLGLRAVWRNVNEEGAATPSVIAVLDGWENVPAERVARSLLLLHFPRPEDAAKAAEMGIAAILPQTLLLAELAEILAGLLPSCEERREVVA